MRENLPIYDILVHIWIILLNVWIKQNLSISFYLLWFVLGMNKLLMAYFLMLTFLDAVNLWLNFNSRMDFN
jgi:hypothetical protein